MCYTTFGITDAGFLVLVKLLTCVRKIEKKKRLILLVDSEIRTHESPPQQQEKTDVVQPTTPFDHWRKVNQLPARNTSLVNTALFYDMLL